MQFGSLGAVEVESFVPIVDGLSGSIEVTWVALGVLILTAVDLYPGISFKTSGSGSLIDIVSVFSDVEALLVSVVFDVMGGESVSDDSESASLIVDVFDFAIVDTSLVP